jgi:hypothetical protein
MDLQRLIELSGGKNVTIADATSKKGIDRNKADRILDPHDYFGRNKRKYGRLHEYLAMVEAR